VALPGAQVPAGIALRIMDHHFEVTTLRDRTMLQEVIKKLTMRIRTGYIFPRIGLL
jgi:hypothetical protein